MDKDDLEMMAERMEQLENRSRILDMLIENGIINIQGDEMLYSLDEVIENYGFTRSN